MTIGSDRAAAALSEMTRQSISLTLPTVKITLAGEIDHELCGRFAARVARVDVPFSGALSGMGSLLLDSASVEELTRLLTPPTNGRDPTGSEVVTEVGSILLNACIGTFGNFLPAEIAFGVPEFQWVEPAACPPLVPRRPEFAEMVWAETKFALQENTISGFVVVGVPPSTIQRLADAIQQRRRG